MSIIIGLAAGVFGGLVGVGGGVIMIPLMVGVLSLSQHKAHGTSIAAIIFTGISGAVTYSLNGSVDILSSVLLAAAAIITARAGARYTSSLPEWKLKIFFGYFLLVVSVLLLLRPYLTPLSSPAELWERVVLLFLIGGFTGFVSGMLGVGGGSVMVPALVLLAGYSQHTAQGISLITMIPIGIVGALTHWRLGNVHTSTLTGLIPAILVGTFLGGSLAQFLPEAALRVIFAAVLIYTGIRYTGTKPKKQD